MSNLLIKSYLIKKKIKTVKQFTQFSHNVQTMYEAHTFSPVAVASFPQVSW